MSEVIDHVGIRVSDLSASRLMYEAALAALGFVVLSEGEFEGDAYVLFGRADSNDFCLHTVGSKPGRDRVTTGAHIAFCARDADSVTRWHDAAVGHGGTDIGAPGVRPEYSGYYYAAFVLDPDGNNVEAVFNTPAKLADDPFSGRHPTSHERMTGRPWDASYHDGAAPWDIGRPQPAVVRVASEGGFAGAVLDAGCGTGENALHVAGLGLSVLGVDVAETALAIAREKAGDRGLEVEFAAADAFRLERLGRRFETVLDCGLFHTLDPDERPVYVASLASVTEHDGTLYVLCFSDDGPETGPHPISEEELRAAFNPSSGWNVAAIEPDRIQTTFRDDGAPAWFATLKRI